VEYIGSQGKWKKGLIGRKTTSTNPVGTYPFHTYSSTISLLLFKMKSFRKNISSIHSSSFAD